MCVYVHGIFKMGKIIHSMAKKVEYGAAFKE